MDRNDVDWTGYIPAITTPFNASGELDLAALERQLTWLVEQRMHGVILAGTSGEWFAMSTAERATLFAEAAKIIGGQITVLAGCNAFTADEAIEHARAAENAGLDGILLTPPPYVVPTDREVVAFYTEVCAATGMPVCVYNWPRGCIVDLDIPVLGELASIGNVVAIKNSTGDFGRFLQGLYELGDQVRYFGIPTSRLGADLVDLGHGDGLMGAGAVLGADHPEFWRALERGDRETALRLGERDRILMSRWFTPDYGARFGNAQAILKTALRLRGVPAGHVRRPLLELEPPEVARVEATMRELGIETVPLR
ncbi:MAG TPA: dihydrodipicolinate synthase family protein [Nocardioides sp.]|uniref:dihydrodipicolinate synthase family protein n=1 Tax=Nocardioides sp. TaxID=35761 RepID=UPI002CB9A49C|nr:dihydrodipicolinate synthase family protein [Nocardioides sp.]HQR25525.1 dihydrodipicolinate synthase family protein [Nocardioides sp.]